MTTPCRACGKPMIFAETPNGHRMPIDPDPVPNGNIVLQERFGAIPSATIVDAGKGTHVSHFVTCPHAPQFRRK